MIFRWAFLQSTILGAVRFLQSGLLLRCQTLTSPRRQRRVVHPEYFPLAPKCCTCGTTTKRRCVWHKTRSSDTHVEWHFNQSGLAARAAITDYVTDSDAWWTQPLAKASLDLKTSQGPIVTRLRHPSGAREPADTRQTALKHAAETKCTKTSIKTTGSGLLQLFERPGWSAVLHSLCCCTHFWDQPFHFTRYSQRPCKTHRNR